jgi:hypothetical protein
MRRLAVLTALLAVFSVWGLFSVSENAYGWTHCGTPQAEPDCSSTPSTTVDATPSSASPSTTADAPPASSSTTVDSPPASLPPGDYCQDTRGVVGDQTTVPCPPQYTVPIPTTAAATTVPPTTAPPTTVPPTTAAPVVPTTIDAAPAPPPTNPPPTGASSVPSSLPATGSAAVLLAKAAFAMLFVGVFLILAITRGQAHRKAKR